jgi:hypothetical protein
MMEALSFHKFDRHFQIARTTALRADFSIAAALQWHSTEKTGNIQHCIEINDRKYRAVESYMRTAPPPGWEIPFFSAGVFVGVEAHHQHLQPRQNITGVLKYMGIGNTQQAEEDYRSSAETANWRANASSSADGLAHMFHEHAMIALLRAVLSFAVGTCDVELSWLDDLLPADATTLQVRAGRVLGRCHAALGQHMLSVSAFDAAIGLARSGKLLLSEALSVRGRAAAGRNGTGGSGLHWDEETGKQRLVEVMSRMQGPKEALARVMVLQ